MLKKAWLEDCFAFVQSLRGTTAEVLGHMLIMEADFRVFLVTLNALNTNQSKKGSCATAMLSTPSSGYLYPERAREPQVAWNGKAVRAALEPYYSQHLPLFDQIKLLYEAEG